MKPTKIAGHSRFRFRAGAVATLALLPALLLATGCGHHETKATSSGEAGPTDVEVIQPRKIPLTRQVEQPGQLLSYEHTPIYTKIAGFAEKVYVDIGDTVKKDQLLVKLWVPEVEEDLNVKAARVQRDRADVKQARATVDAVKAAVEASQAIVDETKAGIARADADVKRWQAEDERAQKLLRQSIYDKQTRDEVHKQLLASQAGFDEAKAKHATARATLRERQAQAAKAEADVEVADARLKLAQSEYNQWKAWLSYSELRAPFDGIVTLRNVHTGHFLQPANSGSTSKMADPLFTVMRMDIMRVTVEVPEIDAVYVKVGDRAVVRPQALPGREVIGSVTRFSWSLDEHARTLRVEVHLPNSEGELRPGMYANVSIFAKQAYALALPPEAILNDILAHNDRSYCVVVENGQCHKLFVQVGLRGEEGVQVLRKQKPGGAWENFTGLEAVVVSHPASLLDGQTVQTKTREK